MGDTKNCITCGKPAVVWCGHVHTEIGTVIVGHCQEHYGIPGGKQIKGCDSPNPNSCYGFVNLESIELQEPLTESYIATVNGKLELINRDEYFRTDEAKVRKKKRWFLSFLFD